MDKLTKEQQEELKRLAEGIISESKKVVKDFKDNPSEVSGSVTVVHENSPYLKEKHERLIKIDKKA